MATSAIRLARITPYVTMRLRASLDTAGSIFIGADAFILSWAVRHEDTPIRSIE